MKCQTVEEQLWLYLYEEMAADERAVLDAHFARCEACRARLQEADGLRTLLAEREAAEPSPELLVEAREALEAALDRDEMGWRGWFRSLTSGVPALYASRAASVLTILVLGFGLGWMLGPSPAQSPEGREDRRESFPVAFGAGGANPGDYHISNISELAPDPQTGEVQITLDTQRQVTLSGSLDDPQIQRVLLFAVRNYENPGIRRDSLGLLRQRAGDREVRQTLIYVLANDANDGVRMEALEAAQSLGWSEDLRDALVGVVRSNANPGLRVAAVNLLVRNADLQALPVLREIANQDESTYVRMQCASAVRELAGEEF